MKMKFTTILLITLAVLIDVDSISGNRYDKSKEAYILRKGGVSQRIKKINGQFLIGRVYVAPQMRKKISITNPFDLLAYTICERTVKEIFPNMTTRTYKYMVCPNETPSIVNLNTIKEYCCGFPTECCNASSFMSTLRFKYERRESSFSYRALLSVVGFFIFVIIILVVIKMMFGTRIRQRWDTIQVFRQQRSQPGNNYQVAEPLMNPPGNYPGQVTSPGNTQYPYPPSGPYNYGPPPPLSSGQYPYNAGSYPPQYAACTPQPPFVQYPSGPNAPSQPPPNYEKAIRQ